MCMEMNSFVLYCVLLCSFNLLFVLLVLCCVWMFFVSSVFVCIYVSRDRGRHIEHNTKCQQSRKSLFNSCCLLCVHSILLYVLLCLPCFDFLYIYLCFHIWVVKKKNNNSRLPLLSRVHILAGDVCARIGCTNFENIFCTWRRKVYRIGYKPTFSTNKT